MLELINEVVFHFDNSRVRVFESAENCYLSVESRLDTGISEFEHFYYEVFVGFYYLSLIGKYILFTICLIPSDALVD